MFKWELVRLVRPSKKSYFGIHDIEGIQLLTQLRVHFSNLREHKFRHKFQCSGLMCLCQTGTENNEHFFLHCPHHSNHRKDLLARIPNVVDVDIGYFSSTDLCNSLLYGNSHHHIFIIAQLWLTSHMRSTVVPLDTGTPDTSRELFSEDADGETQTRSPFSKQCISKVFKAMYGVISQTDVSKILYFSTLITESVFFGFSNYSVDSIFFLFLIYFSLVVTVFCRCLHVAYDLRIKIFEY